MKFFYETYCIANKQLLLSNESLLSSLLVLLAAPATAPTIQLLSAKAYMAY
jgi:hypothetical protein